MRFDGKKPIEFTDETVALEEENLEEDTKYKLKLDAPKSEPAFGGSGGEESLDAFDDAPADGGGGFGDAGGFGDEEGGDEPFDATPFDADVEADEDEDPEKYIQQLAGKLGTSLRKYNDERGEPDFDLEKYAINSVVSASHTSEMDEEDQKDIIRKVKTSGASDDNDDIDKDLDEPTDDGFDDAPEEEPIDDEGGFGEEELDEDLDIFDKDAEKAANKDMKKHFRKPGFDHKTGYEPSGEWPGHTLPTDTFDDADLDDDYVDVKYDMGDEINEEEPLDRYLRQIKDKNQMVDSFYLMFLKTTNGKPWNRLISKTEPMAKDEEFEARNSDYNKIFVDGENGGKINNNWGDYMSKHIMDPVFDEFREGTSLNYNEESSIFAENNNMRNTIKGKLDEMAEPDVKPAEPVVVPETKPTKPRRTRIFQPNPGVKTPAKMKGDGSDTE